MLLAVAMVAGETQAGMMMEPKAENFGKKMMADLDAPRGAEEEPKTVHLELDSEEHK